MYPVCQRTNVPCPHIWYPWVSSVEELGKDTSKKLELWLHLNIQSLKCLKMESVYKKVTVDQIEITVSLGKVSISNKRGTVLAGLIWVTRLNHIPVGEMGFPNGDRCLLCQFHGAEGEEKMRICEGRSYPKERKTFL